jgi:hypothetical protein
LEKAWLPVADKRMKNRIVFDRIRFCLIGL